MAWFGFERTRCWIENVIESITFGYFDDFVKKTRIHLVFLNLAFDIYILIITQSIIFYIIYNSDSCTRLGLVKFDIRKPDSGNVTIFNGIIISIGKYVIFHIRLY